MKWKKIRLNGYVYEFSVNCNITDTSNITDIHKYLMKKIWYKTLFGLIKKTFMALLINKANASNHIKCVSLNNQKCMI